MENLQKLIPICNSKKKSLINFKRKIFFFFSPIKLNTWYNDMGNEQRK